MTPWMRKLHKWVGVVIAIQFVLWLASGVAMSLLDAGEVQGRQYRVKTPPVAGWPADAMPAAAVIARSDKPVMSVASGWLLDQPVYRLANDKATWMVGARDARPVALDAALATKIAQASYSGSGSPAGARLLDYTLEARSHKQPVWRVDFSDDAGTSVYVSALNGNVLEHRNDTWRLFDFFWMLHIMDYAERTNFNNPLIVTSAVGGLWMALTGVWLLVATFRVTEFIPARWRRAGTVNALGADGGRLCTAQATQGDTVFQAFAQHGLQLPSNCGGGQSCGLCAVRCIGTAPPPTSADRALLSAEKLGAGYRLACNLPVAGNLDVEVPGATLAEHTGTVTSVRAVAPFLREITIRTGSPLDCRPGAFVQVHVPPYSRDTSAIALPEEHRAEWRALRLPPALENTEPVRRAYSLALPVQQAEGQLTLLVRFVAGERPGRGSGYLYTLKEGDTVRLSGPFGDFALRPGGREKVFIGGGAGMAPLRAMIHALLSAGAQEPIHFWYGARSRRDAAYVKEMEWLATAHPNFHWHLVLSGDEGAGFHGQMVHEAVRDGMLEGRALGELDFYLCGPPAMLAVTRAMLAGLGVQEEQIAFDDFKV